MDQKTILDALQKALANGSGSLDDLNQLLDRAKSDIAQAKREEEEAARKAKEAAERAKIKRGEDIAGLATRLLAEQPTAEDVAMMLTAFLKTKGFETGVTAEEVEDCFASSVKLHSELDQLMNAVKDLGDIFNTKPKKERESDDILDQFLRQRGLR